jgi:hypothetical protein
MTPDERKTTIKQTNYLTRDVEMSFFVEHCPICDNTGWVCEAHGNHPSECVSHRSDACADGPGMPCPSVECKNTVHEKVHALCVNADKFTVARDERDAARIDLLAANEEIERYRKTLRDIVRQCNNPIHTCPAGMDRIIERIEEMAIDALGYQAPNNNPLKAD